MEVLMGMRAVWVAGRLESGFSREPTNAAINPFGTGYTQKRHNIADRHMYTLLFASR
jgi:hypothetical protein